MSLLHHKKSSLSIGKKATAERKHLFPVISERKSSSIHFIGANMKEKKAENAVEKIVPKKPWINWAAVYQYLLDYCNDTTIHGFKVCLESA